MRGRQLCSCVVSHGLRCTHTPDHANIAEYAQVVKMLGNGRIEAKCFDGVTRLAHIRGKMRKKVWIAQGDIILLSLRDFQDDKADVIVKYTPDEARDLKNYGELPASAIINENEAGPDGEEGDDIEFGIDEDEIDDICESLTDARTGIDMTESRTVSSYSGFARLCRRPSWERLYALALSTLLVLFVFRLVRLTSSSSLDFSFSSQQFGFLGCFDTLERIRTQLCKGMALSLLIHELQC